MDKFLHTPPQQMNRLIINDFGRNFDAKSPKVIIVSICGGQGGGKTKLSKILCKNISKSAIIEERSYFKIEESNNKLNTESEPIFDEIGGYKKERKLLMVDLSNPNSYDYAKLYQNLKSLKEGNPISLKIFSEDLGSYTGEEVQINPKETSLVILEGYFLFRDPKVKDLIDLKIYVEIDNDIRLSRLLLNESKFLNNNSLAIKNFFDIYKNYIKTSYEQYIEPTKHEAGIILPNYTIRDDEVIDGDNTFESLTLMLKSVVEKRAKKNKSKDAHS